MTPGQDFLAATRSYERWRASRIPVVSDDLRTKHEKLASSPFVLLRGTYYRFLAQFGRLLPELAHAPSTVVVGDLHIENFGTWRDCDGRLAWGINDFDEVDVLPYTIDLIRLATSAVLAIKASHLRLHPQAACDAIHHGWRERIERRSPVAFVLGERHAHLYKLASEAFEEPVRFERGMKALAQWNHQLPKAAARLLAEVAPWPEFVPELRARTAGVGSLGSRRIVAIGELDGGLVVREAKQIPGPASIWINPKHRRIRGLADLVADERGIAADPRRRQRRKWVLRRLAPDATRLDLATLHRKHNEASFLRSMGAEAANVHPCRRRRAATAKALRKDDDARDRSWLRAAAATMAELTERDHAAWCAHLR